MHWHSFPNSLCRYWYFHRYVIKSGFPEYGQIFCGFHLTGQTISSMSCLFICSRTSGNLSSVMEWIINRTALHWQLSKSVRVQKSGTGMRTQMQIHFHSVLKLCGYREIMSDSKFKVIPGFICSQTIASCERVQFNPTSNPMCNLMLPSAIPNLAYILWLGSNPFHRICKFAWESFHRRQTKLQGANTNLKGSYSEGSEKLQTIWKTGDCLLESKYILGLITNVEQVCDRAGEGLRRGNALRTGVEWQ